MVYLQSEQIFNFLAAAKDLNASDIHIYVDSPLMCRINGKIIPYNDKILSYSDVENIVKTITPKQKLLELQSTGEVDFAYEIPDISRFRVNVFKERSNYAIAMRIIKSDIPNAIDYNIPKTIMELAKLNSGLVLITGPTGSGKSTTLAAILNEINENRNAHVITLEDPIEFVHKNKKSIFNQREIGQDSNSYQEALRATLRQDPDVILIGEMRDYETMSIALTTAETGHLVFSTMHTLGACKSINRIVDVFPPHQQNQIRIQLASILEAIVSIQLVPHISGKSVVAAYEIMKVTPAIRNLIREGKNHQILSQIQTGRNIGMQTLDNSLKRLANESLISKENALLYSIDKESMQRDLGMFLGSYNN